MHCSPLIEVQRPSGVSNLDGKTRYSDCEVANLDGHLANLGGEVHHLNGHLANRDEELRHRQRRE